MNIKNVKGKTTNSYALDPHDTANPIKLGKIWPELLLTILNKTLILN